MFLSQSLAQSADELSEWSAVMRHKAGEAVKPPAPHDDPLPAVSLASVAQSHPESTGKVGAVGFCWGGGMVNWLATQLPDLAAGVPFYGSGAPTADVPKIKAPLLIQSAEHDDRINAAWAI